MGGTGASAEGKSTLHSQPQGNSFHSHSPSPTPDKKQHPRFPPFFQDQMHKEALEHRGLRKAGRLMAKQPLTRSLPATKPTPQGPRKSGTGGLGVGGGGGGGRTGDRLMLVTQCSCRLRDPAGARALPRAQMPLLLTAAPHPPLRAHKWLVHPAECFSV